MQRIRADVLGWLGGVGLGLLIDLAHAVAWRAALRRADGDLALVVVVALLAATPLVVTVVVSLKILSLRLTVPRCVVLFVVLALTNVVQSVAYFEVAFPGMLAPVAIGGRGLGLLLSPFAFGVAAVLAWRRIRASTDSASNAGRG